MNRSIAETQTGPTDQSQHVTAVITHRIRPGREEGYEAWIHGISAASREFEGHLGVSILRPQPGASPDYVVVLQFDACDRLQAWLKSDIRKDWIQRVQPLVQQQENIQILTGLEAWFQLPQQAKPSAPKRYKQAILVWVGVMLVAVFISPLIAPLLEPLPHYLALGINVAVTVVCLSYVIMPNLTRWLKRWLFA